MTLLCRHMEDRLMDLMAHAAERGLHGYKADAGEVEQLRRDLGGNLPDWYAEFLTTWPLCGMLLQLEAGWYEPDGSPVDRHDLFWNDPANIRLESLEAHPGAVLLSRGYLCIAGDEADNYFINIAEGNDPPLYQFNHEAGLDADTLIAQGRTTIVSNLSSLFGWVSPIAASSGPGQEPIYWEEFT